MSSRHAILANSDAKIDTRPGRNSLTDALASAQGVLRSLARLVVFAALAVITIEPSVASAKVFIGQNQALEAAFPDATRIERRSELILSKDMQRLEMLTGEDSLPKIVVLHVAWKDDQLLGYAHIDVHNVRTKPEAFMIVLTPEGVVRTVRILAFHEPLDYLPTDRWYAQFQGKGREDRLRVGGDVHGVVGATLSARAAADGVRRMLAYWEVLLRPKSVTSDGVAAVEAP